MKKLLLALSLFTVVGLQAADQQNGEQGTYVMDLSSPKKEKQPLTLKKIVLKRLLVDMLNSEGNEGKTIERKNTGREILSDKYGEDSKTFKLFSNDIKEAVVTFDSPDLNKVTSKKDRTVTIYSSSQ